MGSLATFSLLVLQAQAQDNGYYVGLDIGNTEADLSAKAPSIGYNTSSEDDGGSQTLKVGKYIDENSRVAVFYQNVNADDADVGILGVGYDYLIGDAPLKPFIGAFLGYGSYDVESVDVDISGIVYGIQAGVNYEINTNFSAEAGYRIMKSNMEDSIDVLGHTLTFEIEDIRNWYIGLNYKF